MRTTYQEKQVDASLVRCAKALSLRQAGWTLKSIGDYFGVTQERARQMTWRGAKVAKVSMQRGRGYGRGAAAYQWTVSA